jgi:hypothetical protein
VLVDVYEIELEIEIFRGNLLLNNYMPSLLDKVDVLPS